MERNEIAERNKPLGLEPVRSEDLNIEEIERKRPATNTKSSVGDLDFENAELERKLPVESLSSVEDLDFDEIERNELQNLKPTHFEELDLEREKPGKDTKSLNDLDLEEIEKEEELSTADHIIHLQKIAEAQYKIIKVLKRVEENSRGKKGCNLNELASQIKSISDIIDSKSFNTPR